MESQHLGLYILASLALVCGAALLAQTTTVATLLAALRERGGSFAEELADGRAFRVAVNQDVVDLDHPVQAGDEVAIFPPVTGG